MQQWFLGHLKRHFGEARALEIYVALYRWAGLVVSVIVILALTVAFIIYYDPEHHEHMRYEQAEILGIVPLPSESSAQNSVLDLRLRSGDAERLVARDTIIFGVTDTVCLEKRQYDKSKETFFRIVHLSRCTTDTQVD